MRTALVLVPFLLISLALAYTLPGTDFKGDNDMWGHKIINVSAPANASDVALQSTVTAANSSMKSYVDANDTLLHAFTVSSNSSMKDYVDAVATGGGLATTGGRMTGNISMGGKYIYWLASPFNDTSASTKGYVDANDTLLDAAIVSANNSMKDYVDANDTLISASVVSANSSMKSYVDSNDTLLDAAIVSANSSMKSYVDTRDNVVSSRILSPYDFIIWQNATHTTRYCNNGTSFTYALSADEALVIRPALVSGGKILIKPGNYLIESGQNYSVIGQSYEFKAGLTLYNNTSLTIEPGATIKAGVATGLNMLITNSEVGSVWASGNRNYNIRLDCQGILDGNYANVAHIAYASVPNQDNMIIGFYNIANSSIRVVDARNYGRYGAVLVGGNSRFVTIDYIKGKLGSDVTGEWYAGGIMLTSAYTRDIKVGDVFVDDSKGCGVLVEDNPANITIHSITVNNTNYGFAVLSGRNIQVDNIDTCNTKRGIWIDLQTNSRNKDFQIGRISIYGVTDFGVVVRDGGTGTRNALNSSVMISSLITQKCPVDHMLLDHVSDVFITNWFSDNTGSYFLETGTVDGITIIGGKTFKGIQTNGARFNGVYARLIGYSVG